MSLAQVEFYGHDGKTINGGGSLYLPTYLDWMPIELKMFWFLSRGLGNPDTHQVLMTSQGERLLKPVPDDKPLRDLKYSELLEKTNGLEQAVEQYAGEHGIRRTPRNQ